VGRRRERTAGGFTALYEHEYRPLLRIAYGLTGSQGEAEELVQEAFVRCYQRWAKVEGYDNPGARPARHPAGPAEAGAGDEEFWAAVRRLPRRQAQAIVLYYGDDLPTDDVARVMCCAEGTVRALLHQARTGLAKVLDPEEQS
jgi:DNA-directed RNA polymerase specialized sigma24 family protein